MVCLHGHNVVHSQLFLFDEDEGPLWMLTAMRCFVSVMGALSTLRSFFGFFHVVTSKTVRVLKLRFALFQPQSFLWVCCL